MSDIRAVGGAAQIWSVDGGQAESAVPVNLQTQDPNRLRTGEEALPLAQDQASWPALSPSRGVEDPMVKPLAMLRLKDGAPAASGGAGAAAAPSATPVRQTKSEETKKKLDAYFDRSNNEYKLADGSKVRTPPQFRMNTFDRVSGDSSTFYEGQLKRVLKPKDRALNQAIHMVAYGRGTPEQIQTVTQALIDKGGIAAVKKMWEEKGEAQFKAAFPNTAWPLTDSDAIKLLQWSMGVGVDCAGYAQQEFLAVHGGSPADYGLQSVGQENLTDLKGNKHFKQVGPAEAAPGDLMILDPPAGTNVGHAIMVQDRHTMTGAEAAGYPGPENFANPGDKVQVIVVEGSFGAGGRGDPARGGVQRRTFLFDETTKQWADIRRDWGQASVPSVHISNSDGPYDHPLNGIFRPRGK